MPTLAAVCLADVPKWGGWDGRVPGRAAPRVALSKQYSPLLGDGKTGERVGVGTWGFPCTAVYIQGYSLSGTHCGHLCVCEPPFPMPCMTCDAADTTILCTGVSGAQRDMFHVLLHPPPCDPCTRL